MDIQTLIDKGEELRTKPYDSPSVNLWENDVKAAVAVHGEAMSHVLQQAMSFGFVISSDEHGQQMHNEKISNVQEFLTELQKRNPEESKAQSALITQKKEEARASLGAKLGNATFNNSTVTFGDNSPANNVQVGELMLAIMSQAEEIIPEGPEKTKILDALRSATTNPTFAAIAGASLPEIIKRLVS